MDYVLKIGDIICGGHMAPHMMRKLPQPYIGAP